MSLTPISGFRHHPEHTASTASAASASAATAVSTHASASAEPTPAAAPPADPRLAAITSLRNTYASLRENSIKLLERWKSLSRDPKSNPTHVTQAKEVWEGEVKIAAGIKKEIDRREAELAPKGTIITSYAFGHKINMVRV